MKHTHKSPAPNFQWENKKLTNGIELKLDISEKNPEGSEIDTK